MADRLDRGGFRQLRRYIEPILLTLVIEMAILGVLKEHEAHGYELKKHMANFDAN